MSLALCEHVPRGGKGGAAVIPGTDRKLSWVVTGPAPPSPRRRRPVAGRRACATGLRLRGDGGGSRGVCGTGGAARGRAAPSRSPRRGRGAAAAEHQSGATGPAALWAGPAAVRGRAAGDQVRAAAAPPGGRRGSGGGRRLLGGLATEAGEGADGLGWGRVGARVLSVRA